MVMGIVALGDVRPEVESVTDTTRLVAAAVGVPLTTPAVETLNPAGPLTFFQV